MYRIKLPRLRIARQSLIIIILWFSNFSFIKAQQLNVESTGANMARFEGPSQCYLSWYENGTYIGYLGSFSGSASDVDLGTGFSNATGKIHFAIQAVPKVTIDTEGDLGIGTMNPLEKVHIQSGNLLLSSSNLGIRLNGVDRPFITRGFDLFSSGNYSGIGRWGIFMEPDRMTFGVPNLNGKAFEFAKYNTNSTRTAVLTIDQEGQINRPSTGSANLLPVAFGNISTDGNIRNGSGNFSVTKLISSLEVFDISINGLSLNPSNTTAMLTITSDGSGTVAYWLFYLDGKMRVVLDRSDTASDRDFSFMIYQP